LATWEQLYTAAVDVLVDKPFPSVTQTGDKEWTGSCKLGDDLILERGSSKRGVRQAIYRRWFEHHLERRLRQQESS